MAPPERTCQIRDFGYFRFWTHAVALLLWILPGRKKPGMSLSLNPTRNRLGWLGRLVRREKKWRQKPIFPSSSPHYDALDTTLSQDILAYALCHGKP